MNTLALPLSLAAGAALAGALKMAWRTAGSRRPVWILLGWSLALSAMLAAGGLFGGAPGTFLASALISLAAIAIVATGLQLREAKARAPRDIALEPSDRPSKAWRGGLRVLLAGPIGGVAAIGVGVAVAVWAPGAAQTRIVLGGMLTPLLWAGGMAWTLSDDRILRATAVLVGVAVVTFTASALKGFA